MREILFRGKRIDNGEWVHGQYLKREYSGFTDNSIWTPKGTIPVKPETISQFIGLTDKNGKKIFENDIVRWDDMTNGERWRVAVVEFNPDIQFRIIRIECDFIQSAQEGYVFRFGRFSYKDTHNHLEIIGNIHDDAKL